MITVIELERLPELKAVITTDDNYKPTIKDPDIRRIIRMCLVLDKHKNIAEGDYGNEDRN